MYSPEREASQYNAGWGFLLFLGCIVAVACSFYSIGFLVVMVFREALGYG